MSEEEGGEAASPSAAPAAAAAAGAAAPAVEPNVEVAAVADGGAQARGAPSRGGRPRGPRVQRAGGSGAIVWAEALLVGLLVVVGVVVREPALVLDAEQVGEVAVPLLGLPGAFEQGEWFRAMTRTVRRVPSTGPRSTRALSLCAKLRRTYHPSLQVF